MEMIILKIILCSGIVLGLYYLFLAKEKTFTFNRFYLLLGLVFSYSIPFVTIETPQIENKNPNIIFEQEIPQQVLQIPDASQTEAFDYIQLLWIAYFFVSGLLVLRILYSIIKIKWLKGRKIIYQNRTVVLLEKEIAPFSFLNTIYVSASYYRDEKIDERIFLHEEIHIKQKHSVDVLFIEVLKAFSWFNPFIYFYKNAMITNHEFLADDEVIIKNENIKNYQELILNEVLKQHNLSLTHQFNFNNTKKRFIMMTKKNSKFAEAKKYLAIPVFILLAGFFTEKVYANDKGSFDNYSSLNQSSKVTKSYSIDAIKEFLEITDKYGDIIKNKDFYRFTKEVPRNEQLKLIELRNKINVEDWGKLPIWVSYHEIYKQVPTQKQLDQFLNSKYNITLNGKIVDNSILKSYKKTDFYNVAILKIQPKNPDFGKFEYAVTLYTNDYAKKINSQKNIAVSFTIDSEKYMTKLEKDTITPKKNIDVKVSEVKSSTTNLNDDKVQDLAISPAVNITQEVTTLPEYPGGINAMRNKVSQNFNGAIFKGDEGLVKSDINFTINEKGEVSNVQANGNNEIFNTEAIRSVKLANENITWKPATKDGKPVRYIFKIPLTMTFESAKKTQ